MGRKLCSVNRTLLPLKFTLFSFSAGMFAILPYLTIHMKDIGISDIDIALIYTILPFCVFMAPPIVGFFGDKLGSYTRVLQVNVLACGLFHTLLLAVPKNYNTIVYPTATATIVGSEMSLSFERCESTGEFPVIQNKTKTDMRLLNCSYSCLINVSEMNPCTTLQPHCSTNKAGDYVLKGLVPNLISQGDGNSSLKMEFLADPCFSDGNNQIGELPEGCTLECGAETDLIGFCDIVLGEGRLVTNAVYFVFRVLATMALANTFVMMDAQTLQMCKMEEELGNTGAYGQQVLFMTIAQAIISPTVGVIMDKIKVMTGSTNYVAPFVISDVMLVITCICASIIKKDIGLPKDKNTFDGLKLIFSNISLIIFLIMMFICGANYGFVETFLFVFLKDDLGAPIFLLGLTITTGAFFSLPFLYYADAIIDKVGQINIIIVALLMYGVRYVGYSFITCAWYAFPFEALEVFTFNLLRVGSSKYVREQAPAGTLATLTGLSAGSHFGFGKGVGALVGGVLRDQTSTSMSFRIFGIAAFITGVFYAIFQALIGKKIDRKTLEEKRRKEEKDEKLDPFLDPHKNIVKDADNAANSDDI